MHFLFLLRVTFDNLMELLIYLFIKQMFNYVSLEEFKVTFNCTLKVTLVLLVHFSTFQCTKYTKQTPD